MCWEKILKDEEWATDEDDFRDILVPIRDSMLLAITKAMDEIKAAKLPINTKSFTTEQYVKILDYARKELDYR